MDQSLKRLHQKYSLSAGRVDDFQVPVLSIPRQDAVQNKIDQIRGRIKNSIAGRALGYKRFIGTTYEFQWDNVEGI